ncbi:MAG TPA: hypothetical protein VMO88_17275 [Acidimicrobiales bacterium]|nr:hypothetical protein [Acidimicrobiales bacterium]
MPPAPRQAGTWGSARSTTDGASAKLHLNVPIAPKSRTTFTFQTGSAGTYDWQCMDPCGTDPAGWGGAMATTGYMRGTLTIP